MLTGHAIIWHPVVKCIYGFHMPFFYALSGYLFNPVKWADRGYRCFVKTRLKNYIVPYFIWCGLCFVIIIPVLYIDYHDKGLFSAFLRNVGWILTSVRIDGVFLPQNCTPLWFLTSLFISQMVFYWLVRWKPLWQILIAGCFVVLTFLLHFFRVIPLPWHLDISLVGAVFMLIGYYIRQKKWLDLCPGFVVLIFAIASCILTLYNSDVDIYYRRYGYLSIFMSASVLATFALMWFCKKWFSHPLWFQSCSVLRMARGIVRDFGVYSIIPMGINYTINQYARLLVASIPNVSAQAVKYSEYVILLCNVLLCMAFIALYKKCVSRHPRLSIALGKF